MSAERRLALLQLVHFTLYLLNLLLLAATGEKDEARLAVAVGAQVRAVSAFDDECETAGIGDAVSKAKLWTRRK